MIQPDLQQNIMVTLYLLFAHNYIAFAYLAGALIGLGLAIWRPSRFAIFVFVGFLILLFAFEYDKHIIEGLRQQTTQSLITMNPHFKAKRVIDLVLTELIPVLLYIAGWGMIFTSIIYAALKLGKARKSTQK